MSTIKCYFSVEFGHFSGGEGWGISDAWMVRGRQYGVKGGNLHFYNILNFLRGERIFWFSRENPPPSQTTRWIHYCIILLINKCKNINVFCCTTIVSRIKCWATQQAMGSILIAINYCCIVKPIRYDMSFFESSINCSYYYCWYFSGNRKGWSDSNLCYEHDIIKLMTNKFIQ